MKDEHGRLYLGIDQDGDPIFEGDVVEYNDLLWFAVAATEDHLEGLEELANGFIPAITAGWVNTKKVQS